MWGTDTADHIHIPKLIRDLFRFYAFEFSWEGRKCHICWTRAGILVRIFGFSKIDQSYQIEKKWLDVPFNSLCLCLILCVSSRKRQFLINKQKSHEGTKLYMSTKYKLRLCSPIVNKNLTLFQYASSPFSYTNPQLVLTVYNLKHKSSKSNQINIKINTLPVYDSFTNSVSVMF